MKKLLLGFVLVFLGLGLAEAETTYTFTSKAWDATCNSTTANWTSGKDGNSFQTNQGVQVTSGTSGANATSPISFTNVNKIVVKYCTNSKDGVGTIKLTVGNKAFGKDFSVTKPSSGGTTLKEHEFTSSTPLTGNVNIEVDCTSNSIYINSITIYEAAPGTKGDAGLSFAQESVTCYVDETEEVAFTKATTADVTFTNSDATVAEYEDGVVYAYKEGTCTITATSPENDDYLAGSATLTINVTEAPAAVMIVALNNDGKYYAMSCANGGASGSLAAVEVNVVDGKAVVSSADHNLLWIVADGAIQSVAKDEANINSYLSFNKANISFAAAAQTGWSASDGYLENNRRALIVGNNESNGTFFKTYSTSNINGSDNNNTYGGAGVPMEYVVAPTVTVAAGDHITFSCDKAVAVPKGITAFYMSSVSANEATATSFDGVIPANEGVILKNTTDEDISFVVVESTDAPATITDNLLAPTTGAEIEAGNYVLAQPEGQALGFYPLSANYALPVGKAYLPKANVPSTPGSIKINFGQTGVSAIEAESAGDGIMYNVMGQKVNANYKGIVIINGKKYINK